ncbi:MAG: transglycosylase SLT domain-containing protein [Candidatus Promineifilaceae bacterium]
MIGRYRHLTRTVRPFGDPAYSASRPIAEDFGGYHAVDALAYVLVSGSDAPAFGPIHRRTLLFILVALFVGGGLLSLAPGLSASDLAADVNGRSGQSGEYLAPDHSPSAGLALGPAPTPSGRPDEPEPITIGAISPIFTPEVHHWAPRILGWSARYGLDPDIIATIMQIESCGDPGAISHAGAQGLFQVMPFHFAPGEDMLDPDTNAMRGLAFYNRQLGFTGQDIYLSFAGYNGGYAASDSSYSCWANETQRYYTWAAGIYDEARAGLSNSPTLQQWLDAGGRSLCQQAARHLGL